MVDREKVIKGLHQHCECSLFDRCGECPYYEFSDEQFSCRDRLLEDVLFLLKEQPQIVRCKDCKHGGCRTTYTDGRLAKVVCKKHGTKRNEIWMDADWFCADGERK